MALDDIVTAEGDDAGLLVEIPSNPSFTIIDILGIHSTYHDSLYSELTLICGGMARYATLSKEIGSNARGGNGTCAKLKPSNTTTYGYWYFYVPVSSTFSLSLWHKISSGWNGVLKISIYDIDQSTILLNSENISLVDDDSYHLYTSTPCTPSAAGLCLIRIEILDGSTSGHVFIDDVSL